MHRRWSIQWWFRIFGILWLAGAGSILTAQSPPASGASTPAPPAYSDAEKALAAEIAALQPDEALKKISSSDGDRMTEGLYRALREIGNQASAGDPHRARVICQEAEAVATRAGKPILAADARLTEGQELLEEGLADESLNAFAQAMEMYKAAEAPAKKMAAVYLGRAITHLRVGDFQATLADDSEALKIAQQNGDEVGQARALNGLGNAYEAEGNYSEAETAFTEALRLARANGERLGEAFVLNNLAMMHGGESDYAVAIRFAEQSLEIKRKVGSKLNLGTSLINLGNFYHVEKRDEDANRVLGEATQIGHDLNNNALLAKATAEMGIIQLDNHHPEAALKLLKEGDELGTDVEDLAGHATDLNKIAEAYFELKDYPMALKYSEEAGAINRRSGILDQLDDSERVQGQVHLALGQLNEARDAFQASIDAIEEMRNNVAGGASERQMFMAERTDPYRLLVAVGAKLGDWPLALESSEKGKGRILLDLYTGNGLTASESLTQAERAEETRLRARFLSLDMQYDRAATNSGADAARKNELDASLQKAKTDLAAYRAQLYKVHPDLRVRRADFSAVTVHQMQSLIPDRNTALLEYELTDNGNYLFVATRGAGDAAQIYGYKLAVSSAELARRVRRYHKELATRDPEFAADSQGLFASLLLPAAMQIKDKTSLVIVPDGVLWQLPFQALQAADGKFLAETVAIDYVPSLTVLRALKAADLKRRAVRNLLVMGNPGGQTQEQADEALALKELYGARARAFIGKAATLDQFRHSSGSFDVVHIAAHGIFDDQEPMSSHMLLASADGLPQNGWLRAREIQAMQLHAELVVLSGCETGQGSFEEGEGLVGMSWAVLAAGAHGSLASTWRVEASSTTEMMIAFHRSMLQGVNKAEALRQAQVSLIHSRKYGHPFYWAAFVLMGDGA